ncbi:MAG: AAA family ATPase [Chloroflexi bacterium]|nr:AAA family ATPase [Chloroflexota bacterium]
MARGHLTTQEAVAKVERHLKLPDETTSQPVLILMTGLPGTGKSYVSRLIQRSLPAALVQSDFVRKLLFPQPRYTVDESTMVYRTCHEVIARLLVRGISVIFDATNLIESKREIIYRIADRAGARLVIVRTVTPKSVVLERLGQRGQGIDRDDLSDADATIYERMQHEEEPVRRSYIAVDTSQDLTPAIQKIVREARGT